MTDNAARLPRRMPVARIENNRSRPVYPGNAFVCLGLLLALFGLGIGACSVVNLNASFGLPMATGGLNFITGIVATMTGCKRCKHKRGLIIATLILCCLAIVMDVILLVSSSRAVAALRAVIDTVLDAVLDAASDVYSMYASHVNSNYNLDDIYRKTLAMNIAYIVMAAISSVFIITISTLSCKVLSENTEAEQIVVNGRHLVVLLSRMVEHDQTRGQPERSLRSAHNWSIRETRNARCLVYGTAADRACEHSERSVSLSPLIQSPYELPPPYAQLFAARATSNNSTHPFILDIPPAVECRFPLHPDSR